MINKKNTLKIASEDSNRVLAIYSLILLLFFIFLSGCNTKQKSDDMRKELSTIYSEAMLNPKSYYHMNKARINWMKDKAQYLPRHKLMTHRFYLSQEFLRAGQSEEAISELESILSDIGSRTDKVNNSNKVLIDEHALA